MTLSQPSCWKTLLVWGCALPLAALLCYVVQIIDSHITHEDHLLEIVKTLLLMLAIGLHVHRSRFWSEKMSADIWFRIATAFLCAGFLLREVDIDKLGDPAIWKKVETGLRLITGLGMLVWYICMATHIRQFWQMKTQLVTSPMLALSFTGCLFYLFSWPFDKYIFTSNRSVSQLFEIIFELWATLSLCLAAWYPGRIETTSDEPAQPTGVQTSS